jgi:hypothetical protein
MRYHAKVSLEGTDVGVACDFDLRQLCHVGGSVDERYLKVEDDWDELTSKYARGGDRVISGIKLVGKSLFNIGVFAVTEVAPGMVAHAGSKAETMVEKNRERLSADQIATLEGLAENGRTMVQQRDSWRAQYQADAVNAETTSPAVAATEDEWPPCDDADIDLNIMWLEKRMADNPDDVECQERDGKEIEKLKRRRQLLQNRKPE